MKVYRVSQDVIDYEPEGNTRSDESILVGFAYDLSSAKKMVKSLPDSYVDLVSIPTDKKTLIKLLNGDKHIADSLCSSPERSWERTPRGGLREIPMVQ